MGEVINTCDINLSECKKIPIHIKFPSNWYPPQRSSPFAKTLENETIKWMKTCQVISSNQEEIITRNFDIDKYSGYSGCSLNYENALVYSKMICLWLLWDDVEAEGVSDPLYYKNLVKLLSEPSNTGNNVCSYNERFIYAWKHIGDEITRLGGSLEFRKRFASRIGDWINYACEEVKFLKRASENISFDDVMNARKVTIGMYPTSVFGERGTGIELPDQILNHMEPIYESISFTVSLVNDLVSVAKDLKNGTLSSNCVLWYMTKSGCTYLEAYKHILLLLDDNIKKFDIVAKQIVSSVDKEWTERVSAYFDTLRYISSGFAQWHVECRRYLKYTLKENDTYFRVEME